MKLPAIKPAKPRPRDKDIVQNAGATLDDYREVKDLFKK